MTALNNSLPREAKPSLLVLMPLGSEVRQFGHSGLLSRLLDAGWRVVCVAKIIDDDLREQLDSRVELVDFPCGRLSASPARLSSLLDRAHALCRQRQGASTWAYVPLKPGNWRQAAYFKLEGALAAMLSYTPPLFALSRMIERRLLRNMRVPGWQARFVGDRPSVLLVNVPRGGSVEPALVAAAQAHIPTVVLFHTWKDPDAIGRLTHYFDIVGVWNARMRQAVIEQNAGLPQGRVRLIGCGHFDGIGQAPGPSQKELREHLGLNSQDSLLLFIASAPWVVPEEERYIEILWAAARKGVLPSDLQIVVRLNPMDATARLEQSLRNCWPGVKVLRPDWRWDAKRNWCFQRKADFTLYTALLRHSSVCVGVPSTVAVECALADLPMVNIGFDLPGPPCLNGSVEAFWNAPFYANVRRCGAAILARSPEDLVAAVRDCLTDRSIMRPDRQSLAQLELGVQPPHAAEAAFAALQEIADVPAFASTER